MITHRHLHLHLLVKGDGQHSSGVGGPMGKSTVCDRPRSYRWACCRQWPVCSQKMVISCWNCRCCIWSSGGGLCWVVHSSYVGLCWVVHSSGGGLCWVAHLSYVGLCWVAHSSGGGLCWVAQSSGGGLCWVAHSSELWHLCRRVGALAVWVKYKIKKLKK